MSASNESTTAATAESQSLRLLVSGLITAVLVGSIGINALLYKQLQMLKAANADAIPKFESSVKRFNEVEAVKAAALINELIVFSKTNPDFAEILKKYELRQNPPAADQPAPAK